MANDTAILVLSCDKYADAWNPFFQLFRKYWPQCPFPVYLGTNESRFDLEKVKVIHSGKPQNWSADTRAILEQIPEKYIIVLLEDYFLTAKVDEILLNNCLAEVMQRDAAFMRIACFRHDHFPMYAYDMISGNSFCGITRSSAPYRVTLQAGIWNKEVWLSLLQEGESPWEFETKGSERSRSSEKLFLGLKDDPAQSYVHGPILYLCTAITKGKWMRETIGLCEKENISIDLSARPMESRWAYFKRKIYSRLPYGKRKYPDFIKSRLSGK